MQPCAQPSGALTLDVGRAPVREEGFQADVVLAACDHPGVVICELAPNGAGAGEGPFAQASRALGERPAGPTLARGAVSLGFGGVVDLEGLNEAAAAMAGRMPAGALGDLLGAVDGRRLAGSLLNDPILAGLGIGGVSFDVDGFGGRLGFGAGEGDGTTPPPAEGQGGDGDFGGLFPGGLPAGFFEGFGLGGVGDVPSTPGLDDLLGGLSAGAAPGMGGGDAEARAQRALGPAMGVIADALTPPLGGRPASPTDPTVAGGLPAPPPGAMDDVSGMIYGAGSLIIDATTAGAEVTGAAAGGALLGILKGTWTMLKMAGDAASGLVVTQSLNAEERAELDRTVVKYDAEKDGSPYSFCTKHFEGRTGLFKHCMADKDNAEEWRCSDKSTSSDKKDCKGDGEKPSSGGSQMCLEEDCDDTGRNPFVKLPKAQGDRAGLAAALGCGGRSEAGRPMDPQGEQCEAMQPVSAAMVHAIACKRTCMAAMCTDTSCGPVAMPNRVRPGYTSGGVNPGNTTPDGR